MYPPLIPRGGHGMSSHVSGGRRVGDYPGGTWDELPCEWGVETREGYKQAPPSSFGGHRSSSHVPPPNKEGGAYLCPSLVSTPPLTWELIPCSPMGNLPLSSPHSHGSSAHVPPLGDLPLSTPHSHGSSSHVPSGGMRAHPMPLPLIGDMEAHPMSP